MSDVGAITRCCSACMCCLRRVKVPEEKVGSGEGHAIARFSTLAAGGPRLPCARAKSSCKYHVKHLMPQDTSCHK